MLTVRTLCTSGEKVEGPVIGLEVEVERWGLQEACYEPPKGIRPVEDGSLRRGMELQTRAGPYTYKEGIDLIYDYKEACGAVFTERTGIHTHMNVQDLDFSQLRWLCYNYMHNEGLLFETFAAERTENGFCIPWSECLPHLDKYLRVLNPNVLKDYGPDVLLHLERFPKYTALNLGPLRTLGTVEFRHLPGLSRAQLVHWCEALAQMYDASVERRAWEFDCPNRKDILLEWGSVGAELFVRERLGESRAKRLNPARKSPTIREGNLTWEVNAGPRFYVEGTDGPINANPLPADPEIFDGHLDEDG